MDGRPTGSSSVTSSPPSLFASHTLALPPPPSALLVGNERTPPSSAGVGPPPPSVPPPPRASVVLEEDNDARISYACIVLSVSSIPVTSFPSTFTAVPPSTGGRIPNDGELATFPNSVTRPVSIMRSA